MYKKKGVFGKGSLIWMIPLLIFGLTGCQGLLGAKMVVQSDRLQMQRDGEVFRLILDGQSCATFQPPLLGDSNPSESLFTPEGDWIHASFSWDVEQDISQDELSIPFDLSFDPDFWWAPHLTPSEGYVAAQHVFRAPAVIARKGRLSFVLVPDLEHVGQLPDNPWFLDYDARVDRIWLGMSETDIPDHVLFKKKKGMAFSPGRVCLAFYITAYEDQEETPNPWGKATRFLWERWARPLYAKGEPGRVPLDRYVEHTYNWAFDTWGDVVWQEFELEGKRVGAPQFIVNYSQSPNYPGRWFQREFLSIWNQAWFSSLRSASGVFRYARRKKDPTLEQKALLTKELALAAPLEKGLFPTVIRTDNIEVEIEGKKYRRPKDWDTSYWTNSNRRPWDHGITSDWFHVLDCSWTCLLMLRWNNELEPDKRLVDYSRTYGDKLLSLQDGEGFFPGWLHPETLEPGPVMNRTPETSMSVTFLLALAKATGESRYEAAALRAMEAVLKEIVPEGRWEDYETYWSCCSWGRKKYLGKKIERNEMYKQNTLSIFWTAEALLECYRHTRDSRYLAWGRRTIDELSMFQQVWQPPFIYVPALGGFGVMNADGEWTDSRETLFAELFMEYYRETGDPHLFERGVAALKSGFIMMYCPENPRAKVQWEKRYPWFGPEDYGFTIENYGHGGKTSPEGGGIGPFTIYDWGNGAASEARNRIFDHFGDVYIDRTRGHGFGIDSIGVKRVEDGWRLTDLAGEPREIRIVFEDGSNRILRLDQTTRITP